MKLSKILIILGIGCVAGLLLVYGVKLQAQNRPDRDAFIAKMGEMNPDMASRMAQFRNRQQGSNRGSQNPSNKEESKENTDYYRTIVDNNIFRPLGWRPPKKEPEYEFIGTSVEENGAKLEAYVNERRSNKFYIATIGDKVGDAVVKEISEKEIILDKDGETITLRGGNMSFLKAGGSNRSSSRSNDRDENNNNDSSRSRDREAEAKAKAEARMKAEMEKRQQEMRRRFESVSREQRDRMIRAFRERGGSRRGR